MQGKHTKILRSDPGAGHCRVPGDDPLPGAGSGHVPLVGFDHGVGPPLLFLCDAKASNYKKNNRLEDLGHYAEWPKVADAVIKADLGHAIKIALVYTGLDTMAL